MTSWTSFNDCNDPGYSLSLHWPFDQPLDNLISPETLETWMPGDCADFQPSDLFNHGVDMPLPSQYSARASHDSGSGSVLDQQEFVQSSDNGSISQGLFYLSCTTVLCSLAKLFSDSQSQLPTLLPRPVTSTLSTSSTRSKTSAKPSHIEKRQSNTLAARRYRQRRVDQMKNLEAELEKVKRERDELRIRVSKLEGETEALRGLFQRDRK